MWMALTSFYTWINGWCLRWRVKNFRSSERNVTRVERYTSNDMMQQEMFYDNEPHSRICMHELSTVFFPRQINKMERMNELFKFPEKKKKKTLHAICLLVRCQKSHIFQFTKTNLSLIESLNNCQCCVGIEFDWNLSQNRNEMVFKLHETNKKSSKKGPQIISIVCFVVLHSFRY